MNPVADIVKNGARGGPETISWLGTTMPPRRAAQREEAP